MAIKNTVREGVPWSSDLEPMGPVPQYDWRERVSQDSPHMTGAMDALEPGLINQDEPRDLYAGLPDITVPKRRTEGE